jgi:riboflavin synthase
MFSGIVEARSELLSYTPENQSVRIQIKRPPHFEDIHRGDSIAVNGVCLTVEKFDDQKIEFVLGAETLKVLRWDQSQLAARPLNLERSIAVGDRIHGHFVLGHVDGLAVCTKSDALGDCHILRIQLPETFAAYVWYKGSITLAGVSLTINDVTGSEIEVCLIPETIRATNLTSFKAGHQVPFEVDQMARAFVRAQSLGVNRELNS